MEETGSSLPKELSFDEALKRTRMENISAVDMPPFPWEAHSIGWGARTKPLSDSKINPSLPPLFMNGPVEVAALP